MKHTQCVTEQEPSHAPCELPDTQPALSCYLAEHRHALLLIFYWLTTNSALLETQAWRRFLCVCVCVCCCSLHTLFCGPRYWRLLLFVPPFFFLCPFDFPDMVCVLLPVSIAPPPPPMPQLTPQIPLTGFVARVQENSKFGQAELLKGRAYSLLACMAGKSDSILFPFPEANTILHSSVNMLLELKGTLFNIL